MSNLPALTGPDWTHDERLFVNLYIETGNATQSAIQAFQEPDPVKASRKGNYGLKANREVFNLVLEREGITDHAIAKGIAEGMQAERKTYAKHMGEIGELEDIELLESLKDRFNNEFYVEFAVDGAIKLIKG